MNRKKLKLLIMIFLYYFSIFFVAYYLNEVAFGVLTPSSLRYLEHQLMLYYLPLYCLMYYVVCVVRN
jgi:hypothetical protein